MNSSQTGASLYCSQCGQPKPEQELAHFGNVLVCGACKPAYAQRLSEGGIAPAGFHYGGFWIRFVAYLIDALIVGFASAAMQVILIRPMMGSASQPSGAAFGAAAIAMLGVAYLVGIAIAATYEGLFVYKVGATPGKMALGLRVVRPDGGPISLGRAIGRYFAKMLSAIVLLIGYIMIGFDKEKRGLHDLLVDTRVIKKRS
jgi:uncharacterized RDD family membrane protein YckC